MIIFVVPSAEGGAAAALIIEKRQFQLVVFAADGEVCKIDFLDSGIILVLIFFDPRNPVMQFPLNSLWGLSPLFPLRAVFFRQIFFFLYGVEYR